MRSIQSEPEYFAPPQLRDEIANLRRLQKKHGYNDLRMSVIVRLTAALNVQLAAERKSGWST